MLAVGHIYHKLPYSVKIGPIKKTKKNTRIKSIHTSRHADVKNLKNWDRAAEHLTVLTHQLYCSAPCCVFFFFAICAGRPFVLSLEVSRGLQHLLLFCFVFFPSWENPVPSLSQLRSSRRHWFPAFTFTPPARC